MNIQQTLNKLILKVYFCEGTYVPFLSSLAQSSKFIENKEIKSPLGTDGVNIHYNPNILENFPEQNLFAEYIHCLWHIARLHNLRGKGKDKDKWEYACDVVINRSLIDKKNQYGQYFKPLFNCDDNFDKSWSEERIYQHLKDKDKENENKNKSLSSPGSNVYHLVEAPEDNTSQQLVKVQTAVQNQKMIGAGLEEMADIAKVLETWGKPKVNWSKELKQFFIDKAEPEDITWKRPNRRYSDLYMPSKDSETGRLTHLMYFIDVSGSIADEDINTFLNEAHGVFEELNPEKMTIISFNHKLVDKFVFDENNPFKKVEINIGGGTDYRPIHDILLQEKPTAAVIFTDLCCAPMEPVKKVPVLWVVKKNEYYERHKLKTGRLIVMENKKHDS